MVMARITKRSCPELSRVLGHGHLQTCAMIAQLSPFWSKATDCPAKPMPPSSIPHVRTSIGIQVRKSTSACTKLSLNITSVNPLLSPFYLYTSELAQASSCRPEGRVVAPSFRVRFSSEKRGCGGRPMVPRGYGAGGRQGFGAGYQFSISKPMQGY